MRFLSLTPSYASSCTHCLSPRSATDRGKAVRFLSLSPSCTSSCTRCISPRSMAKCSCVSSTARASSSPTAPEVGVVPLSLFDNNGVCRTVLTPLRNSVRSVSLLKPRVTAYNPALTAIVAAAPKRMRFQNSSLAPSSRGCFDMKPRATERMITERSD